MKICQRARKIRPLTGLFRHFVPLGSLCPSGHFAQPSVTSASCGHQDRRRVPVLLCFAERGPVARIGRRDPSVHKEVLKASTATIARITTNGRHTQTGNGIIVIEPVTIICAGSCSCYCRHMTEILHADLFYVFPYTCRLQLPVRWLHASFLK